MNAIDVLDLECRVDGRVILQVQQLQIPVGQRVGVVGHNGAGKSTLLRVLGGFVPPGLARVQVLGRSLQTPLSAQARRDWHAAVGQTHQGLHLVGRLTALENTLIGALHRMPGWRSWARLFPPQLVAQAHAAMDQVGLQDKAGLRVDQLSGGERQKVSLARLKLQQPRLILADEPTSALDPRAAQAIAGWLGNGFASVTSITVVHQPDLLPLLADRVLGLRAGRIVLDQPMAKVDFAMLAELYQEPLTPTQARANGSGVA